MEIRKDTVASIHYKLTDPKGKVLDSSEGRDPLAYLHGRGQVIPGLESALEGKQAGESLSVRIPPAEAYGERNEELVQRIPRSNFGKNTKVEAGMQFEASTPDGRQTTVRVVRHEGDKVVVDANHPLAGMELAFDITIDSVRQATDEELEHGHAHGPDGHHHH